jgi:hypothetical protein
MRDPARIPKILARLQVVWEDHPDMRLGQLIENVYGCIQRGDKYCFYHMEDEDFIRNIEDTQHSQATADVTT